MAAASAFVIIAREIKKGGTPTNEITCLVIRGAIVQRLRANTNRDEGLLTEGTNNFGDENSSDCTSDIGNWFYLI